MSVVVGLGKAATAGVLRGARSATRGRVFPKTKWALVVALVLFAAFAATLSAASQAPNVKHSYYSAASSTPDRSGAAAPVSSEPQAAPQISEREALDTC